jgi:hypothetical protein
MRNIASPLLLTTFFLSFSAFASDFQSPRTAALGGSGHAAPLLTDAIYQNPSFASFLHAYQGSLNYGVYKGGDEQPDGSKPVHGHLTNIAVQDGRNDMFQAGVGLTIREDSKYIDVGTSKAIVEKFGLGLGGKFILPNSGNGSRTQDFNISGTFLATDWAMASFLIDNIVQSNSLKAQNLYREFVLGTKINIQNLMLIYIDPHLAPNAPGSNFGYENGIELTPFTDLFIRFGMFRSSNVPELQNARGRGYGFGIGWVAPKLSLDYGLKRTLDPIVTNTHNFGMTVYF